MKRYKLLLLTVVLIIGSNAFLQPTYAKETTLSTRSETLQFLKDAFQAQLKLNHGYRNYEEVVNVLDPYFSYDFIKLFSEENLYKEEQGYITYGTDFARYYIPFYSYSGKTHVVFEEDKIHVYEFFEANKEGPVTYQDHYEIVSLAKGGNGWRIYQIEYHDVLPTFSSNETKPLPKTVVKDHPPVKRKQTVAIQGWNSFIIPKYFPPQLFTKTMIIHSLLQMEYKNQSIRM
ncbi:DUF3993 domain-containing protein [Bacillus timonensis]|nr:DUF3993 domain-containing protein [Bacillus timonensis]